MNITLKKSDDDMILMYIEGVLQGIVHIDAFFTAKEEVYDKLQKGEEVCMNMMPT